MSIVIKIAVVSVVIFLILLLIGRNAEKKKKKQEEELKKLQEKNEKQEQQRKEWINNYINDLKRAFGEDVAKKITEAKPWLGMSIEMLVAMYGSPNDKEETVLKTKSKLVLVYKVFNQNTNRDNLNRYFFENNLLTKFEVKTEPTLVWNKAKLEAPFSFKNDNSK